MSVLDSLFKVFRPNYSEQANKAVGKSRNTPAHKKKTRDLFGRFFKSNPSTIEISDLHVIREIYRRIFYPPLASEGDYHNIDDENHILYDAGLAPTEEVAKTSKRRHISVKKLADKEKNIANLQGAYAHRDIRNAIRYLERYMLDRFENKGIMGHGHVYSDDTRNLLCECILDLYLHLANYLKTPAMMEEARDFLDRLDQFISDVSDNSSSCFAKAQLIPTSEASKLSDDISARQTVHSHETFKKLKAINKCIKLKITRRINEMNVRDFIVRSDALFDVLVDQTFPNVQDALFISKDAKEGTPIDREEYFFPENKQEESQEENQGGNEGDENKVEAEDRENDLNLARTCYYRNHFANYERPLYEKGSSGAYYETDEAFDFLKAYLFSSISKNLKKYISDNDIDEMVLLINRLYSLQAMLSKSTRIFGDIKTLTDDVGEIGVSCLFDKFLTALNALCSLLSEYQTVINGLADKCEAIKIKDSRIADCEEEAAYQALLVNFPRYLRTHLNMLSNYSVTMENLKKYTKECTPKKIQERFEKAKKRLRHLRNEVLPAMAREIYARLGIENEMSVAEVSGIGPELPIMPLFEDLKHLDDFNSEYDEIKSETIVLEASEQFDDGYSDEYDEVKSEIGEFQDFPYYNDQDSEHDEIKSETTVFEALEAFDDGDDKTTSKHPTRISQLRRVRERIFNPFKKMFSRNLTKEKAHSLTEKEITDIEDEKLVLPEFEDESISLLLQKRSYDDSCAFYKKKQHDLFDSLSPELANYFNSEAFILNKAILKGEVSVFQRSFMEWVEMYQADPLVASNETVWDDIREKGIRNLADLRICMTFIQFSMTQSLEKGDFEQLERTLNSANALNASAERIYGLVFSRLEALQDRPEKEDVPPESENTQQELENVEVQGKSNSLFVLTLPFFGKDQGGSPLRSQYGQSAKEYDPMAMSQEHEREPFMLS